MTLADYLRSNGLTDDQFAKICGDGLSSEAVRKWRFGARTPRPAHMRRIREVTKGKVTADDFLDRPAKRRAS